MLECMHESNAKCSPLAVLLAGKFIIVAGESLPFLLGEYLSSFAAAAAVAATAATPTSLRGFLRDAGLCDGSPCACCSIPGSEIPKLAPKPYVKRLHFSYIEYAESVIGVHD